MLWGGSFLVTRHLWNSPSHCSDSCSGASSAWRAIFAMQWAWLAAHHRVGAASADLTLLGCASFVSGFDIIVMAVTANRFSKSSLFLSAWGHVPWSGRCRYCVSSQHLWSFTFTPLIPRGVRLAHLDLFQLEWHQLAVAALTYFLSSPD